MTVSAVWRWSRRAGLVALAVATTSWVVRSAGRPAGPRISRCPLHGVAYDPDLEVCPDCAKS
jgi:hypothetical protein